MCIRDRYNTISPTDLFPPSGAGFLPKILNIKIIDYIFRARDHEAIKYARIMATTEGIAVGLSSGAARCV